MYDSFSESDEELGLLKKALDVELPTNFDPNKIPQNGEEYIQHVMYEAKHCKKLVVATIDKSKLKKPTYTVKVREDCKKAPKSMVPTLEWQQKGLSHFIQCSKYISTIMQVSPDDSFNEAVLFDSLEKNSPQLSVMSQLGQNAKIRLLQRIIQILENVQPGHSINRELGSWIYGVLLTFEIPLTPEACHCLRELARRCSVIRGNLSENCEERLYAPLNLFICIVARYFKQLDLADDENEL